MCARNIHGGKTSPYLPLTELRLEDIQLIFPVDFVRQLKKIYLCGNYGDPASGQDTLEVLQYFRSAHPQINLGIHTNGGVRPASWWSQLAEVVSYCRFGIDGLSDTNHLYRRGVSWDRLQANVKAFIAAGGRAEWDFLLFKHNEHQLEEARNLAQNMGFKDFQVKNTSRFFNKRSTQTQKEYEVQDAQGQNVYNLEPTTLGAYQNAALENDYKKVALEFGSVDAYWDQASIECRIAKEKSLYVSAEGLVFPCCWTAGQLYMPHAEQNESNNQMWRMIQALPLGKDSLSALRLPIQEIIEGSFFQRDLPESWNKSRIAEGKPQVCARTCGAYVKPFESQFIKT